jgi:hypothetical protein
MRYYLDTEFDGDGGRLISLALVREDGESIYLTFPSLQKVQPWVAQHVLPHVRKVPPYVEVITIQPGDRIGAALAVAGFLAGDEEPFITTDWPDDIKYMCDVVVTGPGLMANIGRLTFDMVRVDAYPTTLQGAVRHNAWWDAMALRQLFVEADAPPKLEIVGGTDAPV